MLDLFVERGPFFGGGDGDRHHFGRFGHLADGGELVVVFLLFRRDPNVKRHHVQPPTVAAESDG